MQLSSRRLIQPCPLILSPDTTVATTVKVMSQVKASCVLVVEQQNLVGIFTERDLVRNMARGTALAEVKLRDCMTQQVLTLQEGELDDLFSVLRQLRHHHIRHLPVIDHNGDIIGIITPQSIRNAMEPGDLLRYRRVEEVMNTRVIAAPTETCLTAIVELMSLHRVSCVVIITHEALPEWGSPSTPAPASKIPIGIITERDMVKFQALELDFDQVQVQDVMSTPLVHIQPHDSLWHAHQQMQQLQVRRLVVVNETGDLLGIMTQTSVLQAIDPLELSSVLESLQQVVEERTAALNQEIAHRKQIEQSLQERESMLRKLGDNLDRGLLYQLVHDPQKGYYFSYIGAGIERLVGVTADAILQNPRILHDLILEEDQITMECLTEESLQNLTVFEMQMRKRTPQGTIQWSQLRSTPQRLEDGRTVWDGIEVDITELKHTEAALRQSEAQLNAFFDSAPDGMAIVDDQLRFVKINQRLAQIDGVSIEAHIGKFIREVIPKLAPSIEPLYQQILATGQPILNHEICGELPNQPGIERYWLCSYFPLTSLEGKVTLMGAIVIEITDRKRAEQDLQQSEERWQLVIQGNHDAIWDWDIITNQIVYSDRWYEMLGYTLPTPPHSYQDWFNRIHPDDVEQVLNANRAYLSRHIPTYTVEYRLRCQDSHYKWVISRGQAQWNEQNRPIRMVGSIQDISDRKQAEVELQQAKEAAETASLAKSLFVANMSHELRTPLNAILGFVQVMQRDEMLTPGQRDNLNTIDRSGNHLLNLINDILDVSKIETNRITLELETFDLRVLLQSIESIIHLQARNKGLQFIIEVSDQVPQYITADSHRLHQILINLLNNAVKFTDRGQIRLRSYGQPSHAEFPASNSHPRHFTDQVLWFEVEDTGIGLSPTEVDTIFEAFVQTQAGRASVGGSGLGLTISQKLVQMMGGEISVVSTLGQGSCFTFYLPIATATTPAQPNQRDRPVIGILPDQSHHRILVVDDQRENRELLTQLVKLTKMEVRTATSGQEAVEIWQDWQPDLIWMDLRMPGMNGYEAVQTIRQQAPLHPHPTEKPTKGYTKIIALSASVFESDRDLALQVGCDDFLSKPFQQAEFFSKMAKQLGLQCVYAEQETPQLEVQAIPSSPLSAEDVRLMPLEWIRLLHTAALLCDDEQLYQLLAEVPPQMPHLANHLVRLIQRYQFHQILDLTRVILSEQ